MYRDKSKSLYHVNFLFNEGGLGDLIARLPAIEYVLKHHKEVIPHVWVPDYAIDLTKRCLSSGAIIKGFTEGFKKYNKDFPGRMSDSNVYTNLSSHMTDHGFSLLANKQVDNIHKDYLKINVDDVDITKFNLPDKYVVLTTGYTSEVREFSPDTVNTLIFYIKSKGYEVVFLGKTETFNGYAHTIKGSFNAKIDFHKGINLVDQTSMLETVKIIYNSKTIVGVDNGLLHIACTHPELPVVGGFTSVNPITRMAYRNGGKLGYNYYPVVPPESLGCRFCQTNMVFEYNHETFMKCYYKDTLCVKLLTPDLFVNELEKIL